MSVDESADYEQVVHGRDDSVGLHAIIAIYSTTLGPALGGARFYPYADEQGALRDVLNLSRAMAYKAACAGLPLGGGKAVIIGDPSRDKSEGLLRAFGRFVQSLDGRYYTACDVGTSVEDMAVIARESDYVTGRPVADGGAGDSSVLTAYGVFRGMAASAEYTWGRHAMHGRRVGVLGVGKVGRRLVEYLLADGASVVVADVDGDAVAQIRSEFPEVEGADPEKLPEMDLDVYAPCALGGSLDDEIVSRLQAAVVCGGANNQLAHPGVDAELSRRGIRYAPDYVVNAGGLIQVAGEVDGYGEAIARRRTGMIFETTRQVFADADRAGIPTGRAADQLAERLIAARVGAPAMRTGRHRAAT